MLQEQIREHRLVHALLIAGEPGTGKRTLAGLISGSLMCLSGYGIPCGKCSGCLMAASGEHPDITVVQKGIPLSPDIKKGRATIPVDDIREIIRVCSQYAFEGVNRAIQILDAENMTIQAQNALLKILEEPPENTFFILTSCHPEQLLPTIRSRCRSIKLNPWDDSYIVSVLTESGTDSDKAFKAAKEASGSIGKALKLAADEDYWKMRGDIMNDFFRLHSRSEILGISTAWKDRKAEADVFFGILESNINAMLRYRIGTRDSGLIEEFPEPWQRFAASADLGQFTYLADRICEARKQCFFNVNFQAVVEQLLLSLAGEREKWAK